MASIDYMCDAGYAAPPKLKYDRQMKIVSCRMRGLDKANGSPTQTDA